MYTFIVGSGEILMESTSKQNVKIQDPPLQRSMLFYVNNDYSVIIGSDKKVAIDVLTMYID